MIRNALFRDRLIISFCMVFIPWCIPLTAEWYIPDDWFQPASYIDEINTSPDRSIRYKFSFISDELKQNFEGPVALEKSNGHEEAPMWLVGRSSLFRLSDNSEIDLVILFNVFRALYVRPAGTSSQVIWINHLMNQDEDFYEIYSASNVPLTTNSDYVQGRFVAHGKFYKIQDGNLVPDSTKTITPGSKTFYFQLKINPLLPIQKEILSKAKNDFGEICKLVLQEMNE